MIKKEKFYITTAIDYASGAPHLGHAYEKITTDFLAIWNRGIGYDVFFQTGLDEHGQKIFEKSIEIKKEPQEFVDLISKQFLNLISKLNISNDSFIRTTNNSHKKIVQQMIQKSFDNGDIYKGKYEGLYCVGCEKYYVEEDLLEGNLCPDHKKKVEFKSEENYFFALSKYQKKLLDFYKKNPEFISPKSKQKEILNRVEEGLNDISISRSKKSLSWGIEIPFDKTHVTYVWFDALFNYYSGLIINNKKEFWPVNVQIIGHDISWFHVVYWPAFLMSVGLELPKKVFSHGMILDGNGHKMSKSLGNVIDPIKFSREFGVDEMRYFFLSSGSFGDDICFSKQLFAEKINNELNNDFGNLVSRVHSMCLKYFNGVVPEVGTFNEIDEAYLSKLNIFEKFNEEMQNLKFNFAIERLWNVIRACNAYINLVSPWKEKDEKRLQTIIVILVSSVKMFGNYIEHIMPIKAEKLRKQFNFKKDNKFIFEIVKGNHKLNKKENLFEKIILNDEKTTPVLKRVETGRENLDKNNQIKNIIFDFDGVICDTIKIMYQIHCESFGEIGFDEWKIKVFSKNAHDSSDFKKIKETEIFFKKWSCAFENFKLEKSIKSELLKLSKKYNLFIISSNSENNLKLFFENNNFINIFKKIYGFETNKCKIEKFKILFNQYNINKKNSIFITDSIGDIKDAKQVGIKTIAVDFGVFNRDELKVEKPFKIVSKFKEIRKTIEKLNSNDENKIKINDTKKEGFSSLNLKVGKILSVKQHPDAEKLFIEEIDLGEDNPRQIVSGLSAYYKLEEMIGKKVIVVCNLKPAKLRGVKSEGMVLVSEDESNKEDIKLGLLLSNAKIGTHLICENEIADNPSRIKIDYFFKINFTSNGEKIYFDEKEVFDKSKTLKVDRKIKGIVC